MQDSVERDEMSTSPHRQERSPHLIKVLEFILRIAAWCEKPQRFCSPFVVLSYTFIELPGA
jgi:hypothetical protein